MTKMYERMVNEQLYKGGDPLTRAYFIEGKKLAHHYNQIPFENFDERQKTLKKLFNVLGENIYMEQPIYVDYGRHVTIGKNFYANFSCTLLDVAPITIGDNVLFGPNVSLITAGHPIDPSIRSTGVEFGKSIHIGNNVWLGANVVVNPGVTIGENTVIGSGSIVTKNIPANVVAVGNPCRILRPLTEDDFNHWNALYQDFLADTNN